MTFKSSNIETDRLGDEWGFYIDVDNENVQNFKTNEDIIRKKYNVNKCYSNVINDFDEYEYYNRNYKNYDDDFSIDSSLAMSYESDKLNYNFVSKIISVSSTTIITATITYIIFCVL